MAGTDESKGRAKKAVGEVTGNDRLKVEGEVDKIKGKVDDVVDSVADTLKGD